MSDPQTGARGPFPVGLADIERAQAVIKDVAIRTPLFNSRFLTDKAGENGRVLFKAENLQRTGSFKIRGVLNKLHALGAKASAGIVVASAGNHAQAAALGAREAGVSCHVFMPAGASISKYEATKAYGASVHLGGESVDECLEMAAERAKESGEILVHPFDDPAIIAGQGTLGLELLEDLPDLSLVVVPVGGGGLASGVALALKEKRPSVRVVGVQAAACDPVLQSFASGRTETARPRATLADGIALKRPGEITLPILRDLLDDLVAVDEEDIADAMVLLLERAKLLVEGAGAVGVAAVLSGAVEVAQSGATVLVLSGGNVDTGLLSPAIRRHETNAGRSLALWARVPDRPGELAGLLTVLGSAGANLVTVDHLREGYDLEVRETGLHVVVDTRDRDHAAAVLRATREAGYDVIPVESPWRQAQHGSETGR